MARSIPAPVVSTGWLAAELGAADLVVVDASWSLPSAGRNPREEFRRAHIPGAVFWDLDATSDPASDLPHMLPPPDLLARQLGAHGIGNDTGVVAYDGSGANLSAARLWWTLKVAGHEAVAVLDGGLGAWRAEGRPLGTGETCPRPRPYRVRMRPELIASLDQVRGTVADQSAQRLDARSRGRFAAAEPEPRPGLRGGHIPGARNLPYGELVGADGRMLPLEELARRYRAAGIDLGRPVIASCGSGVSACALALGLELLGHRRWAIYDGSWAEWGREGGPPIER